MKICVIRHGETDWNVEGRLQGREDILLNANGESQAERVGEHLRGISWNAVITSPLSRALRTAETIARITGVKDIVTDDCFLERDYGCASGMTKVERDILYPDGAYPFMESTESLRERVYRGLKLYTGTYAPHSIIIVSHGSAINALLAILSHDRIGTGKTALKNAAMNMLECHGDEYRMVYTNLSVVD